ncbi:ribonuclease H-like domain, reverse transcriptase, RNA-dependent DNA polymerase [Tanacetum coccineum]
MIACVEKTEHNADFHQIVDYLTGCSINYSLLVDPDLIGLWLQQFWATASLRSINEVPHIRAMVAGKQQVIWDSLRDIIYEGNLAQLTFYKPLFSPQWKYLVHVLLYCLSPKSTSWEQFGTNIASALVGLTTNQKFNFSLMIMNGMLGHIANGKPFLMYPRFIQLFLNKQLEGVTSPQNFLPSVILPSKVFTFMRKNSPKFSGRITPLTSPMLEVITELAAEEAHTRRVFWGADEELSDGGPEHLPSPDYVPGPEHPPSPVEVPYVLEPEYPEYLVTSDAEAPLEDQPLPADASPTALLLGYVVDFDPDEDLEEDPEEDHSDYPADGGDGDDEPSDDDDDDTDDEDEEPIEEEDDDEDEEEHLALVDSSAIPVIDHVPSAGDTEAFETDDSTPTP